MDYAVIRTGGKQYRVAPGDLIRIEKLAGDAGAAVAFNEVLMTSANGGLKVGAPLVAGARVTGEIVRQGRAKKILVFKKKRRKNYRRHQGHRQYETTVRVTGIESE
ncbi:MAG TPA: 50S ribosomal protein L21 [Candidatus Binatia bacterium]|nr:50S ribosomal protein L21 [Candidatus Binatia bacterium]